MPAITRRISHIALALILAISMIPISATQEHAWAGSSPTVELAASNTVQISKSVMYGPYTLTKGSSIAFTFSLTTASSAVFSFLQNPASSGDNSLSAVLSDSYGRSIQSWNIHGSTKSTMFFGNFILNKGTYSLTFTANMSVSDIYLKANWETLQNVAGNGFGPSFDIESEPNDARENANWLTPSSDFMGSFYDPEHETYINLPLVSSTPTAFGQDIDSLVFELDEATKVKFTLVAYSGVIFNLYSSEGNTISTDILKKGKNVIDLGELSRGRYYIGLVNNHGDTDSWGKEYIARIDLNKKIAPILSVQNIVMTHGLLESGYFRNPVTYNGDGKLDYESSNSSVVRVYSNGDMIAKKVGSAIITVTASEGTKYKRAAISFRVNVIDDTGDSASSGSTYPGTTPGIGKITPSLAARSPVMSLKTTDTGFSKNQIVYNGNGRLTYTTSNRNVVSVYSDGDMLAMGAGTAIITVTASETSSYYGASTSFKVVVTKPSSGFRLSKSKVVVAWSGSFRNNFVNSSGGTIKQASSNKKVATINSNGRVTYKSIGESTMSAIQDETDYYAKSTAYWTLMIVPDATDIWFADPLRGGFKVKWSKQAKKLCTGYEIRYSTNKSMKGSQVKTVKGANKQTAKIGKLKGGKRYYVQVRVYKTVNGKNYCSAWSKKTAVRTK